VRYWFSSPLFESFAILVISFQANSVIELTSAVQDFRSTEGGAYEGDIQASMRNILAVRLLQMKMLWLSWRESLPPHPAYYWHT
jgi:hypothetical protein